MFKSNDFKEKSGNGTPKIINPGTHYCRVIDVTLDAPAYNKEAYHIVLKVEGVDRGDEFPYSPTLGKVTTYISWPSIW